MKLIIVDDHVLFREGIAAIFRTESDIEIVALVGSVQEAIRITRESKPDVILMDYHLPDGTGVEATGQILAEHPCCKVIFLTIHEEDAALLAAVRSGAKGYLMKTIRPQKLLAAIRSVYQGESAISRAMTLRLMEELARTSLAVQPANPLQETLTPREQEVLRVLAAGLTNQQISAQLFLSTNTVKYHVHSILDKLNISNRREAAQYARQNGLII